MGIVIGFSKEQASGGLQLDTDGQAQGRGVLVRRRRVQEGSKLGDGGSLEAAHDHGVIYRRHTTDMS